VRKTNWREVFSYPRNLVLSILTNLSQTGGNGLCCGRRPCSS